jgi:hypothetical protein
LKPLGHKGAAPILSHNLLAILRTIQSKFLWLFLQLEVRAEGVYIVSGTIGFARLAEFAQGQEGVGGQMVDLSVKSFQNSAKKATAWEAETTREIIPKN